MVATRAAIYCRVSSAGQAKDQTIESQRRVLGDYVRRMGWELAGTFEDDGRSAGVGQLGRRDGFARLIAAAEARQFDVLAVADIDRLTRTTSMEERAEILGPFQRLAIPIYTPTGGMLDLQTQLGEMSATMLALGAAAWREQHRRRVKEGRITAAARGRLPAGCPPYGLVYDAATKSLALHPERAPLVVEIFERVVSGTSCGELAREFHTRGIQRPRGRWVGAAIAEIIRSTHPRGLWACNSGTTIDVPRIVSDELWAAAQAAVTRSKINSTLRVKRDYLLVGIGTCALCGSPIWIRSPDHHARPVYICRNRLRPLSPAERCGAPTIRTDLADARVWAVIERELWSDDLERAIAGEVAGRTADARSWQDDRAGYERKLTRLATAESRLLAMFTAERISEPALNTELARIAGERRLLQDSLDAATRAAATAGETAARLRSASEIVTALRAVRADAPHAVRRRLLEQLAPGGVVFGGPEIRLELQIPRPAVAWANPCSVDDSARRTIHETHLRIRTVA